jgi:hypothetical protein
LIFFIDIFNYICDNNLNKIQIYHLSFINNDLKKVSINKPFCLIFQ